MVNPVKEELFKHLDIINKELQDICEDNEIMRVEIEDYFENYKKMIDREYADV